MQNVKEQGFEKFEILIHTLKVETLESGERNGVFRAVENEAELASLRPLREPIGEAMPEGVGNTFLNRGALPQSRLIFGYLLVLCFTDQSPLESSRQHCCFQEAP